MEERTIVLDTFPHLSLFRDVVHVFTSCAGRIRRLSTSWCCIYAHEFQCQRAVEFGIRSGKSGIDLSQLVCRNGLHDFVQTLDASVGLDLLDWHNRCEG
jgi:hypothetical protein